MRNTFSSKKRARKERTEHLSIYKGDETMNVKSKKDRVTVVFSTVFKGDDDVVIGEMFMQAFKEGHRATPQPHECSLAPGNLLWS